MGFPTMQVKGVVVVPVEFEAPVSHDMDKDYGELSWYNITCEAEIEYEAEREAKGENWWIEYEVGAMINIVVINHEGDEIEIPEEGPLLDWVVDLIDDYLLRTRFDDIVYKCNEDASERAMS